jgi:KUP system potassium uptake protein
MSEGETSHRGAWLTLVGAVGVVFGDIGTSPLYAMRTILGESDTLDTATVYGMTSTVIWSLLIVVTLLYVGLLLRTDNEGEGGLLALLGLLRQAPSRARVTVVATIIAIAGAAMFIGDSVVTPAISVLAAAEGLETASPSLKAAVLPIALVILVGVFVLQRVGSGKIGALYGPVMVLWFAVLAACGAVSLARDPQALQVLSPHWAIRFFLDDPAVAFLSLGAVILAVTGAEALYADLGHFGRAAITRAWLFLVFPSLVLAYVGEAAAVVRQPSVAADPFYAVVPGWATIPVLVLATLATIIASEAVIAGAFTVLHQAGGLGLFPYLRTRHPSPDVGGRIYLPAANWSLAVMVLLVVATFRSSDKLASAYGVAVAGTILTTVMLFLVLDRSRAGRVTIRQVLGGLCFLVMLAFLAGTVPKIVSGGWVPVGIGIVLFAVMWTWWSGRRRLASARQRAEGAPDDVLREVVGSPAELTRLPGTAVFLTEDKDVAPFALRTMVEAGHILPERVVLLSWQVEDTPAAPAHETAVEVDTFDNRYDGIVGVSVTLGYRERLEAEHVLSEVLEQEPDRLAGIDAATALYIDSEPIPEKSSNSAMRLWRQRLFLAVNRLATDRVDQMSLPRDRAVVIGREFEL